MFHKPKAGDGEHVVVIRLDLTLEIDDFAPGEVKPAEKQAVPRRYRFTDQFEWDLNSTCANADTFATELYDELRTSAVLPRPSVAAVSPPPPPAAAAAA